MYTSLEDARSDLFLSGAVYVFAPIVLRIVLATVPLGRLPGVGAVLAVVLPLAVTVLVPYLLLRYRGESLRLYGLYRAAAHTMVAGVVVAAPIVAAVVVGLLLQGTSPAAGVPLLALADAGAVQLLGRLAGWVGVACLAAYVTVKARDAFVSAPKALAEAVGEIGRVLAVVAAVTAVLLQVAFGLAPQLLLVPLGVAAAVWLALRTPRAPAGTTTRATLLTPVVLLALGSFLLSFDAVQFVFAVWQAAVAAGVGLAIGVLQETRRTAFPAVGVGLLLGALTTLEITRL